MQDGAPGHASQKLKILFTSLLSMESIPSHSLPSHLNLIQLRWYGTRWKTGFKSAIQEITSYLMMPLQEVVRAAWEAVPESFLNNLIESIQARFQAVIEADSGHAERTDRGIKSGKARVIERRQGNALKGILSKSWMIGTWINGDGLG